MPSPTAVRPSWHSIPGPLRAAISRKIGSAVLRADNPTGGFTPGLAARLSLDTGRRVFVKAIPASHPLAASYQHEAAAASLLPKQVPAPALLWHEKIIGWIVVAYDDIDGHHARLAPPGPDLPAVLAAVTAAQVTAVSGLPDAAAQRAGWLHGWAELAADPPPGLHPWISARLGDLAEVESRWLPSAAGNTLVHGDLRADNTLIATGGAVLIDWAHAATGAPWLDLADLASQLILAGYTPAAAEQRLAGLPAWQEAPAEAVTSYAAACAGYWTRSSRLPAPADAPHVRAYQARAAQAAIEWLRWRGLDRHTQRLVCPLIRDRPRRRSLVSFAAFRLVQSQDCRGRDEYST